MNLYYVIFVMFFIGLGMFLIIPPAQYVNLYSGNTSSSFSGTYSQFNQTAASQTGGNYVYNLVIQRLSNPSFGLPIIGITAIAWISGFSLLVLLPFILVSALLNILVLPPVQTIFPEPIGSVIIMFFNITFFLVILHYLSGKSDG